MSNDFFDTYLNIAKKQATINKNDYEEKGLLFCGECNIAKEYELSFMGEKHIVPCQCECERKSFEEELLDKKSQEKKSKIEAVKKIPIQNKGLYDKIFENDNGNTPYSINVAKKYIHEWQTMKNEAIGLLLWGDVGAGKTYTCACICNELLSKGIPVLMTSFSKIISELQGFKIEDKNRFISDLCKFKLILFDDLGTERTTEFASQIVFDVIDTVTLAKIPLLFTTNLSIDDIKNENRIAYKRIYDRVLGASVPIKITGQSQRQIESKSKLELAKKLLK